MTFKKFIGLGIVLAIVMVVVKVFFYQSFNWDESIVHYAFWFIAGFLSTAFIRRLGVITFLEAIVICGVWLVFQLLMDLGITAQVAGYQIFINPPFLIGYLIVIVSMFLFHKKRHIAIRKELQSKK